MRENSVKRRLAEGGTSLGTMVFEFDSSGIARIAAEAGAEFAVFDQEHTGWTSETIRRLMATCGAANLVPMVRVPATQYHLLSQALDCGAMGLMIPMVETAEQAQDIVRFTKYPPQGRRGAAFGVAHDDYAGGDVVAKMARQPGDRAASADRDGAWAGERRGDRGGRGDRRPLDRPLRPDGLDGDPGAVRPPGLSDGGRYRGRGLPRARASRRDVVQGCRGGSAMAEARRRRSHGLGGRAHCRARLPARDRPRRERPCG